MKSVIRDALDANATEVVFDNASVSILTATHDERHFVKGPGRFFMAKSAPYIEGYSRIAQSHPVRNVLELGVYRGGSIVFLDNMLDLDRLTAIELDTQRLPELDAYVANGARSHISIRHGVDQSDRDALERIVDEDFPDGIDLIIDDASHFLAPSRVSFEVLFPRLNRGGTYVVEDWSWAHSNPSDGGDNDDCTELLHEIIALHASKGGMAPFIDLRPGFFSVTRGHAPFPSSFKLSDYQLRRASPPSPSPSPLSPPSPPAASEPKSWLDRLRR